jgi:hypothetical protein
VIFRGILQPFLFIGLFTISFLCGMYRTLILSKDDIQYKCPA